MDVWAAPPEVPAGETSRRWRSDLPVGLAVVVGCVLLGAPVGLLWSVVAPRLTVRFTEDGPQVPNLQSSKAFIGADGSFLLLVLAVGVVTGVLAWLLARRGGPWTVAGLFVGGLLAAVVASRVGLLPGSEEAVSALRNPGQQQGTIELFLGRRDDTDGSLHIRSPWTVVGWPIGALSAFLVAAFRRPEELD